MLRSFPRPWFGDNGWIIASLQSLYFTRNPVRIIDLTEQIGSVNKDGSLRIHFQSSYRNRSISKGDWAATDCNSTAALTTEIAFKVTRITDGTERYVEKAILQFSSSTTPSILWLGTLPTWSYNDYYVRFASQVLDTADDITRSNSNEGQKL
jgi:hypothetical protein